MEIITVKEFYKEVFEGSNKELDGFLEEINIKYIKMTNIFCIDFL